MSRDSQEHLSEFLQYLSNCDPSETERLPSLADLSKQMGISVASLREQLEVARALGLVDVRPKTGIRPLPYSFKPSILQSVAYAITNDPAEFNHFSDLRNHIEISYWYEAVNRLTEEDHDTLRNLLEMARNKLESWPIQVPHAEHRELHLTIYKRLNNPFVQGILETYWEIYEAVGLNVFTDLSYLIQVWRYHEKIVEDICAGKFASGYETLIEHMNFINERPKSAPALG